MVPSEYTQFSWLKQKTCFLMLLFLTFHALKTKLEFGKRNWTILKWQCDIIEICCCFLRQIDFSISAAAGPFFPPLKRRIPLWFWPSTAAAPPSSSRPWIQSRRKRRWPAPRRGWTSRKRRSRSRGRERRKRKSPYLRYIVGYIYSQCVSLDSTSSAVQSVSLDSASFSFIVLNNKSCVRNVWKLKTPLL